MANALIIARGGSKRIPRKNIKPFLGRPMLQRTIEKAKGSGIFDRIYVSTNDSEIKILSENCGATVLLRSEELSNDYATTTDVMADATERLMQLGANVDDVLVCIYPVTPLLNYEWINQAIASLLHSGSNFVFPAQRFEHPVQRGFLIEEDGKILISDLAPQGARTQDLPNYFHDAGQFYAGKVNSWLNRIPIMSNNSKIIEIPKYEVLDIDDELDWKMAEELFKIREDG